MSKETKRDGYFDDVPEDNPGDWLVTVAESIIGAMIVIAIAMMLIWG